MARVRERRQPTDPEAVGLGVLALRNFVNPVAQPTQFEQDTAADLKAMGLTAKQAKRLLANFDGIRPAVRTRHLGKLGVATAMPKAAIRLRNPNAISPSHVVFPQMTLRRNRRGLQHIPAAPGDQVLAPTDYTISYEGMHCIDETGWDWTGSDEIYIITTAVHISPKAKNVVRTERHPQPGATTYGNVDSHNTRVGPRAACWNGKVADVALGMSLTTVVMEHDQGDPNAYRDEIDAAVKLALAVAAKLFPPATPILLLIEASGLLTDFFNWLAGTADDEVGSTTIVLELPDLEEYSRSRTVNYTEKPGVGGQAPTGLKYHFLGQVNDNDYVAAYKVNRNPPAPLFAVNPVE